MVVPWTGFSLSKLLTQVEPKAEARYVRFETLLDPKQMPGQQGKYFEWPYVEGLRLDEAMHDLTILATGCTASPCHHRTARRCGWSCPGSMGSRM